MLSLIEHRCRILIAPDSGVLTMTYDPDVEIPIDVISLWADARQGVLKRAAPSPNPLLHHRPLFAPDERIERLSAASVARAVDEMLRVHEDSSSAVTEAALASAAR